MRDERLQIDVHLSTEKKPLALNITSLKPYVPAKDFELSKRYYSVLGFTLSEGWGGTADFTLDGYAFRLQDYYVKDGQTISCLSSVWMMSPRGINALAK